MSVYFLCIIKFSQIVYYANPYIFLKISFMHLTHSRKLIKKFKKRIKSPILEHVRFSTVDCETDFATVDCHIQKRRPVSTGPSAHWTLSNPRSSIFESCWKWIPYKLIENHNTQRMVTCQSMLSMAKKAHFFDSILTGDEKWIAFDNTHRGRLRLSATMGPKTSQIRQIVAK